jgi:hypothetical protein
MLASRRFLFAASPLSVAAKHRSMLFNTALRAASHAHAAAGPKETLLEALQKRFPEKSDAVASRLEQLKRNHSESILQLLESIIVYSYIRLFNIIVIFACLFVWDYSPIFK